LVVRVFKGAGRQAAIDKPTVQRRLCDWMTALFVRGLPRRIG